MHKVTEYAKRVVSGDLAEKVCKYEKLACQRHINDLKKSEDENYPYTFDESRANRIIEWFEFCKHVRGAMQGQSIQLADWQVFDLGCAFGWVEKKTGARRFTISYEQRARGNAKSTEKSAECLYFMCADAIYPPNKPELEKMQFEYMPEVECVAVDREQAKRVWGDAREMAITSPLISKALIIQKHFIGHAERRGHLKALSKDINNKDSGAPCAVIIDEYHAHRTADIRNDLYGGFGKRRQSFMRIITTAGEYAEVNPAKKERDIAIKILKGEIENENYFAMIRELDEGDNVHDTNNWQKANPLFREVNEYSQKLFELVKSEHDIAFGANDSGRITKWLTKRMNLWQTGGANKYFSAELLEKWDSLAVSKQEFFEMTKGLQSFVGADLSKTIDLTAIAHVFVLPGGRLGVSSHGFLPRDSAIKHEKLDRIPYRVWEDEGWCSFTDGEVIDDNFLYDYIVESEDKYGWLVREFCYDPYNATYLSQKLSEKYGEHNMIEIRQGVYTLSLPTKRFRELVLQGKIVHDGSPLLKWCISNALEIVDHNENIKLSKKTKDDSQRIDLLAAVIDAVVRAMLFLEQETVDVEMWEFD